MTYPFKFAGIEEPTLEFGAHRVWGGLQARAIKASAGRHVSGEANEHRVIFYTNGPTVSDCACEGASQKRLQTPGDFDVVPGGMAGFWIDETPAEMVSVRLSCELMGGIAADLGAPGGHVSLAPRLSARDPLVEHVLRAIVAELEAPGPAGRLYAD